MISIICVLFIQILTAQWQWVLAVAMTFKVADCLKSNIQFFYYGHFSHWFYRIKPPFIYERAVCFN